MADDDDFNMGDMFMNIEGFEEPEETTEPNQPPPPASPLRQLVSQWMGDAPPAEARVPDNYVMDFTPIIFSYFESEDCEEGECLFVITNADHYETTGAVYDGPLPEDDGLLIHFDKVTEGNYIYLGTREAGERILRDSGAREEPRLAEV